MYSKLNLRLLCSITDIHKFFGILNNYFENQIQNVKWTSIFYAPCIVMSKSAALFIQGDRSLSMLIGETVVDSNLTLVRVSTFEKEGSVVGLFFSAHWCPPSRYVSL